jgi:hypothetical protein
MPDSTHPRNPFFPLAALSSVLFIVTILALVAGVFGESQAPVALLLDRYAGRLVAGEVAAILITGFLAMLVDRRQTQRLQMETASLSKKGTALAPRASHVQQHQE